MSFWGGGAGEVAGLDASAKNPTPLSKAQSFSFFWVKTVVMPEF